MNVTNYSRCVELKKEVDLKIDRSSLDKRTRETLPLKHNYKHTHKLSLVPFTHTRAHVHYNYVTISFRELVGFQPIHSNEQIANSSRFGTGQKLIDTLVHIFRPFLRLIPLVKTTPMDQKF